ncbi:MAG TPA: SDR family NAD(P)-dependent oxidoreductase [Mycobacterium sp.]|nr:SDR family NAD(P)-dependent oxidoreductase [Mycobacterium sp.]
MKSVVVTGSSTGIGRACALMLDRNGFRVFAGVRKDADGNALRSAASPSLTPVHIDVTNAVSVQAMADRVKAAVGKAGLDGLVNNAGTTLPCPVEYLSLEDFRRQLEVNLVGPLAVTQALLPLLRQTHGRVVNVTSAAGRAGVPLMAPYVSAKHGLEGLSDVMRLEFRQLGIHVAVIEPGFVGTSMGGKLQRDTVAALSSLPDDGRRRYGPALQKLAEEISRHAQAGSPPDVIAESILHALTSERPRTRYPAGAGAKRMLFMRRILPDRQFDKIILRAGGLEGF